MSQSYFSKTRNAYDSPPTLMHALKANAEMDEIPLPFSSLLTRTRYPWSCSQHPLIHSRGRGSARTWLQHTVDHTAGDSLTSDWPRRQTQCTQNDQGPTSFKAPSTQTSEQHQPTNEPPDRSRATFTSLAYPCSHRPCSWTTAHA